MLSANGRGMLVVRTWHDAEHECRRPRNQRRRPGHPGGRAAEDLRPVLHDEGSRQGHRPRTDRRLRDRPGARRPHPARVAAGRGRVVLRRAAGHRRASCATGAAAARGRRAGRSRRAARRCWSSRTKRRWRRPSPKRCAMRATSSITRATARRRSRSVQRAAVRPGDLRSEDAAGRRHGVLPDAVAARRRRWRKRVIFVTGDVAGTDAEQFLEESGCRWLAKPFRLGDLLRAVRDGLT